MPDTDPEDFSHRLKISCLFFHNGHQHPVDRLPLQKSSGDYVLALSTSSGAASISSSTFTLSSTTDGSSTYQNTTSLFVYGPTFSTNYLNPSEVPLLLLALEHLQDSVYYAYIFYSGLLEYSTLVSFKSGSWGSCLVSDGASCKG
jgi:hypothetical protein